MKPENSKYDLSVCLAAIRKENWARLYDSVVRSIGKYTFEIIFCGPHKELPKELQGFDNIKCVQDYGSPTRAQQISMSGAQGRYITWAADDGWYSSEALESCIEFLDAQPPERRCVVAQYDEGVGDGLGNPDEGMYQMNFHEAIRSSFYPDHFLIFNCAILETSLFHELGGFDCRFETLPMAHADFGARTQLSGIIPALASTIFMCTQFLGDSGDHAPVHYAQLEHDQPLYARIWRKSDCLDRIKIEYDNWKEAAEVWHRRFKDTKGGKTG